MQRIFPRGTKPDQIAAAVSVLVRELDPSISWKVTIEAFKPKRTDAQNRFLHGVVYPAVLEGGGEAGGTPAAGFVTHSAASRCGSFRTATVRKRGR